MVLNRGLSTIISSAADLGKSAIGIFTGEFENVTQIQMALKKGGIIDSVSNLIDSSLSKAKEKGLINSSTVNAIKKEKNDIVKNIESNVENELETQVKNVKKISEYAEKWNENYENKNLEEMENAYKNMERYVKKTIPLETTIQEARTIENLHNLIKNRGGVFNLTEEEINLAEKLAK